MKLLPTYLMSKLSHYLAVTGAWMQVFQIVGIAIMWMQMSRAVGEMHIEDPNNTDAVVKSISTVAKRLGDASQDAIVWGVLSTLGLVGFLFAVIKLRYRRTWAFWFSVLYGGVLLLAFPVGTVLGGIAVSYALFFKREFLEPQRVLLVAEGGPVRRVPNSRRWRRL